MSVVKASVEIDAPPSAVWRVVADPKNLPRWDQHVVAVEGVPPSGLAEGTEYRTWVRFMGVRAHADALVVELRPQEYSKVRLTGLLEAIVETRLEPLDGDRTRLSHRVEYRFIGGPLGRIAARGVKALGAQSALRRGTLAQKRQVEGRT